MCLPCPKHLGMNGKERNPISLPYQYETVLRKIVVSGLMLKCRVVRFAFRTYIPGACNFRPSHIHYKVWQAKVRLLTSQVYCRELAGGSGAAIPSTRHNLRETLLSENADGIFDTDFQIIV